MEAVDSSCSPTILVVDDSPTVLAFVRKILTGCGYAVVTVVSFEELELAMRRHTPDAVVLDLEMPPHTGREAATMIGRLADKKIPIIVYSSKPDREIRTAAYAVGAHGYLRKGGDPAELVYMVRSAVTGTSLAPPWGPTEG